MKPKTNENTTQTAPPAGGDETIVPESVTLSELQTENEQLKATIRTAEAHRQITGELATAGARSPELLFESVRHALQFDGEGQTVNAAALVGELKRRFPEQFGTHASFGIDAGAGVAAAPQLSRDALAKMKPAEIAALDWNEVKRVLAG